ncbi:MAG: hypothetical protein JJT89_10390 [Nitriliruptoraceae bacterium]|nr:hypothetical protein [Nitriliruptoraceae bacterium]
MSFTTFSAIDIAKTGAGFANHWIDQVAHNMANLNTATAEGEEPFRAFKLVAAPLRGGPFAPTGSGVYTAAQVRSDAPANVVYDPGHPLANDDGMVQMTNVDMGGEMIDLMIANRHFQANIRTVQSAREAYQSALRLGTGQ